ncbi:MAG: hypothetical protein WDW36_000233 [Sanguina aurantia]
MADPARKGTTLEEDDEFEEFAADDWDPAVSVGALRNADAWDKSWDDGSLADSIINQQLRTLVAHKSPEPTAPAPAQQPQK